MHNMNDTLNQKNNTLNNTQITTKKNSINNIIFI